ncbi:uncharacterized MFS-type transporter C09D4.1-like [Thrips palmi]|uniref:Uncharacterized MFS-type transporter C09D4.1-like n=1 Tax=Thrips palmi TaxID=161013 RepID=A0A6P8ZHH0_THRPL|nr:uncharacterized MFS-type transporter C09D4.1-like [Thrips palmi]
MDAEGLQPVARPLPRRWLMLAVFSVVSLSNGFQWIQFAIISDSVAAYYNVSEQAVAWTSLVYMVVYIPCILPASWFLDKKGLRWTVVLAALGNCGAAWLKVVAVRPDLWPVLFLGQAVAAVTQGFVLSVPPRLAAVWFGANEVSTATAIGVLGNQIGNAVGFAVPSLLVRSPSADGSNIVGIGFDMRALGYGLAIVSSVTLVVSLLVFQAAPPHPPSRSQAAAESLNERKSVRDFMLSLKSLVTSPGFPQLTVAYGISTGVCFAASTVLNRLILGVFPTSEDDAGFIGLTMTFAGLVSAIMSGVLLDATGKFKELTIGLYCLSVVALAAFTAALFSGTIWIVYITGGLAGFALAGYVPVGFEFAAELTYPASEGTSSGILSAAAQLLGVVFTVACGRLLDEPRGWTWACAGMGGVLAVGAVFACTIPNNLRRQAAQRAET